MLSLLSWWVARQATCHVKLSIKNVCIMDKEEAELNALRSSFPRNWLRIQMIRTRWMRRQACPASRTVGIRSRRRPFAPSDSFLQTSESALLFIGKRIRDRQCWLSSG